VNYQEFAEAHGITVAECTALAPREESRSFGKVVHFPFTLTLQTREGAAHLVPHYSIGEGILERWAREHGPRFFSPDAGESHMDRTMLVNPKSIAGRAYLMHPKVRAAYRPEPADLLLSLASDARCAQDARSFEEFASDMGYDPDSRKAEKIYQACKDTALQLQQWLGLQRYQQLLECEE
jgi:hypothetical protein